MPTTRYLGYILALIITYLITTLAYIKGEGPRLSQGKQLRSDQGTPLLEHYYTWAFDYKYGNFCLHNIWIIWDKDGGSLRVRVRIVWVMERGGVIISVEIFTLKYCSSVRIYVCRKGFQLVLYITAWVFGVAG